MCKFICIFLVICLHINPVINTDICDSQRCKCSSDLNTVNCDTKGWKNLDDIDFPSKVQTLTLINNNLKFDTSIDRIKIENLTILKVLSINQNPLMIIPPFNQLKLRSFSLQDTLLISARFPSSYNGSILQTVLLSQNKITSINADDFTILRDSQVTKLHIDDSSISKIDPNAFVSLKNLQALSLNYNQLKSCEFLVNLPSLSSIKLDGNKFMSLPPQLLTPGKIKTFSFQFNSISVIDESSPLARWAKMNLTNIQIYLANNTFDCCLSLWLIRFLKTSPNFVADASLLTCAGPSDFAGKLLHDLNPDAMNCAGNIPDASWWTLKRIIIVVSACVTVLAILLTVIVIVCYQRRASDIPFRPLSENEDPNENIYAPVSVDRLAEVEDDQQSIADSNPSTPSNAPTESQTVRTREGMDATDRSIIDQSPIEQAALTLSSQ